MKEETLKKVEEELKDLQEIHKTLLDKYTECKRETDEFAASNTELSERVVNLEVDNRDDRKAMKEKLERIEAENKAAIELVEKELQESKENVKKQLRETMKVRKEKEKEKELCKNETKEIEADNDRLRIELKTK